jgi:hypothetical protein
MTVGSGQNSAPTKSLAPLVRAEWVRFIVTHRQGTKCYFLLLNSAELAEFHSPATPLGTMANMDLN